MEIPIFRPTLKRKHLNSVLNCLVSDRIGAERLSDDCAAEFARHLGGTGGVCMASFNQVLHLALEVLQLEKGRTVLVSALAPAYYHAILMERGLIPLIVDVDPSSGLMPLSAVESRLGHDPAALIVTHPLGFLESKELVEKQSLPVIEDVSEALAGGQDAAPGGSGAAIRLLALNPEGIITAGAGGLLVARDKKLLSAAKSSLSRFQPQALLPDMNAALALSQLQDIDRFLEQRREIAGFFSRALAGTRHRTLMQPDEQQNVPFSFPVRVADSMKMVRQYAAKQEIATRPAFSDRIIALGEPQEGRADTEIAASCPNAADLFRRCVLFPLYPTLGKKNVQLIAKVLGTLP